MDDTISLSPNDESFINKFLRGIVELVKVDEHANEKPLPNATFKFERLSGRAVNDETNESDTDDTEETDSEGIGTGLSNEGEDVETEEEANDIDMQQSFELHTDANGRIDQKDLLYGDWVVTEIKAPPGYVLPIDSNGIPKNKLTFTFNKDTKKVHLKFYNQKLPEVLVNTGSNLTGLLIALSLSIILLSSIVLFWAKKNYFAKKAKYGFFSVIVLWGIAVGGTTLSAHEVLNMKDNQIFQSILEDNERNALVQKIDPIDDDGNDTIFDPIEGTEVKNGTEKAKNIEGEKYEKLKPKMSENNREGEGSSNKGTSNTSDKSRENNLAATGESIDVVVSVGVIIVLLSSLILGIKHVKHIKERRNEQ